MNKCDVGRMYIQVKIYTNLLFVQTYTQYSLKNLSYSLTLKNRGKEDNENDWDAFAFSKI